MNQNLAAVRPSPTACPPSSPPTKGQTHPEGLPTDAKLEQIPLSGGNTLQLVVIPIQSDGQETATRSGDALQLAAVATKWVAEAASIPAADSPAATGPVAPPSTPRMVGVPLYGCHVVWSPSRAAVVGPVTHLDQLRGAVVEFAGLESALRDIERRAGVLLDGIEADAAAAFEVDAKSRDQRAGLTRRYREAVAIGRSLALGAAAIHAPPIHPPTLASQVGERLRERTRLAERHEHATVQAELAERVSEAWGQRAADAGIAHRQIALEWAIVVLLVVQTALLMVDLLASGGSS